MRKANKNTLMKLAKEELVERILCLEHNNDSLRKTIDVQYNNSMKIFNGMLELKEINKKEKLPFEVPNMVNESYPMSEVIKEDE